MTKSEFHKFAQIICNVDDDDSDDLLYFATLIEEMYCELTDKVFNSFVAAYFYSHCEPNKEKCDDEIFNLKQSLGLLRSNYIQALRINSVIQENIDAILRYGLGTDYPNLIPGNIERILFSKDPEREKKIDIKVLEEISDAFTKSSKIFISFVRNRQMLVEYVVAKCL